MSEKDQLNALKDIRNMMERSSRFISLSGLTGIFIGCYAIAAAVAGIWYLNKNYVELGIDLSGSSAVGLTTEDLMKFFVPLAVIVLTASIITAILTTKRKAQKAGLKMWDNTAKRMVINLAIPLVTGGLFSLALLWNGSIGYIAPAMLIFYGLALINSSKYTYNDIRYLGLCEIALGLTAMIFLRHGLLFWAMGFGVMHIIYGSVIYYKYDRHI